MGLFLRWMFCWITVAVDWANAYVVYPGPNAPNIWQGYPWHRKPPVHAPPIVPVKKPVQWPPYVPAKPSAQPHYRPHYYPQVYNPYRPLQKPIHQLITPPPTHRPPQPPVNRPVYKPLWMPPNTKTHPAAVDRKQFPFWPNYYHLGPQPPVPAPTEPEKQYYPFPNMPGYYVRKPNVIVKPKPDVPVLQRPYGHYYHPPPPKPSHAAPGPAVLQQLQDLQLPNFVWSPQHGRWIPKFS